MAIIDLGKVSITWRGTYAGGTAYTPKDAVYYNGTSYICTANTTGNLPTDTSYWNKMAEGGDVATTLTTQGDVLYRDGSGLQRLAAGTNGQALITGGSGANPSWGTISSGTYSVHRIDQYSRDAQTQHASSTDYIDIAGGNTVNFTPTSTNDFVFFTHYCRLNWGNAAEGADVYLMMKAGSSSIGSGDTKLNYNGQHASYYNTIADSYTQVSKQIMLPCTNLTVGTTYYVEQAGANHNGNTVTYGGTASNSAAFVAGMQRNHVTMVHYKKN